MQGHRNKGSSTIETEENSPKKKKTAQMAQRANLMKVNNTSNEVQEKYDTAQFKISRKTSEQELQILNLYHCKEGC